MPRPGGDAKGFGWTVRGRPRLVGCLLAGAILVAPFLALLYGTDAGLAVMALALTATASLTGDAARGVPGAARRRLILATAINAALALLCLVALVARLT